MTITGVGGVGKTRLAGELEATGPGGPVHWCELSAIDADDAWPLPWRLRWDATARPAPTP